MGIKFESREQGLEALYGIISMIKSNDTENKRLAKELAKAEATIEKLQARLNGGAKVAKQAPAKKPVAKATVKAKKPVAKKPAPVAKKVVKKVAPAKKPVAKKVVKKTKAALDAFVL